jgi:NADPH-dependent curcumin reductase CurA
MENVKRGKAERLARTVVADFFLYNQDKIDMGLQNDDFFERLKDEIDDSIAFYREHVGGKLELLWDTLFNKLMQREAQLIEES